MKLKTPIAKLSQDETRISEEFAGKEKIVHTGSSGFFKGKVAGKKPACEKINLPFIV